MISNFLIGPTTPNLKLCMNRMALEILAAAFSLPLLLNLLCKEVYQPKAIVAAKTPYLDLPTL